MSNNEDLEYNDGLGDLLREKERHEFSWSKTTIVLLIVVFGIFVALTLAFNFSKTLLTDTAPPAPLLNEPAGEAFQEKVAAIQKEQNNLELIEKLENSLEKADKKASSMAKEPASKKSASPKAPSAAKPAPQASATYYRVFTGAYESYDNAKAALAGIKEKGVDGFIKSKVAEDGARHFRVQVAAFKSKAQAESYKKTLESKEISAYISTQ